MAASPFTSSATPVSSATSNACSRSSSFSGRWLMIRPFGWESDRTAGCRMASIVRFVISLRGARWPAWTLA